MYLSTNRRGGVSTVKFSNKLTSGPSQNPHDIYGTLGILAVSTWELYSIKQAIGPHILRTKVTLTPSPSRPTKNVPINVTQFQNPKTIKIYLIILSIKLILNPSDLFSPTKTSYIEWFEVHQRASNPMPLLMSYLCYLWIWGNILLGVIVFTFQFHGDYFCPLLNARFHTIVGLSVPLSSNIYLSFDLF